VRADGHLFVASETRIFHVDPHAPDPIVVAGGLDDGFTGDGGPAVDALFTAIAGLAFTPAGGLLVADGGNHRLRAIGPPPGVWTGDVTIVGTDQTHITLSGVTTVTGSIIISNNAAAETVHLEGVTSVGGTVTVASNAAATSIDLGNLTSTGGDVIAVGNTAATSIDLGDLTSTGGDVIAVGNTAATSIDLGDLTSTGGDVIAVGNTAATSIDLGDLTSTGGVVDVTGNTAATSVDLGNLTSSNGDVTVENNGDAANVIGGSLEFVNGSLTIESTGAGTFSMGTPDVTGDTTFTTAGYTAVAGTTARRTTTISNATGEAIMYVRLQEGAFSTPVEFQLTHLEAAGLLPQAGLAPGGVSAIVDPVTAYQFTFAVPTLNRTANLTFDVFVSELDPGTQGAFLRALADGAATLAMKSDMPASVYQAFPICAAGEEPTAGGCVRLEKFDAAGQPTSDGPAIVRFSNVVGHFSAWAVVIVTANDATPPAITPTISGSLGENGWYIGDVTITWDAQDPESAVSSSSGCDSAVVTTDTPGTSFTCTATSRGGTTSETVVIKVDKTPPSITCAAPDGLWHQTDVAVGCTADDGLSGLVNAADASFTLVTTVAANSEDANAGTNSRTITDAAGNSVVAGPVLGNRVDKKAPTIAVTSPGPTTYLLNQSIAANYTCADGGSGVGSCAGPVESANVSTIIPGANRFTVHASDRVGNATHATIDYQVRYQPAGTMCHGAPGHQILQPIRADGSSVFKQRSTIPAKFRVCDANGFSIGTQGVVSGFRLVAKIVGTVTTTIDEDVISNTPDTVFRWDAGERQWIFNISNDNRQTNATYVYRIELNDGSPIEFRYGLR
jgi:hypothetical protein